MYIYIYIIYIHVYIYIHTYYCVFVGNVNDPSSFPPNHWIDHYRSTLEKPVTKAFPGPMPQQPATGLDRAMEQLELSLNSIAVYVDQ